MGSLRIGLVTAVALLAACSMRGVPDTLDIGAVDRAVRETAPAAPLRVIFGWRILDGDARLSGQGAARIEGPYRARLDLFGPRDEGYLSAALVGTELRLRREPDQALPHPAMMWAILGVVSPPEDAVLQGTRERGNGLEIHYAVDGSRLRYVLEDGRLRSVEWRGAGRRMVVELQGATHGLPRKSAYRDWSRNTELHIELESVEEVEPYPPEIWTPGR
jgi:hypothetical protein